MCRDSVVSAVSCGWMANDAAWCDRVTDDCRSEEDLGPITLHNQALIHMEEDPTTLVVSVHGCSSHIRARIPLAQATFWCCT